MPNMVKACLQTGTHYCDITGEIDVFEKVYAQHDKAIEKNIALIPGVGFDVVPTDCVVAKNFSRSAARCHPSRTELSGARWHLSWHAPNRYLSHGQ